MCLTYELGSSFVRPTISSSWPISSPIGRLPKIGNTYWHEIKQCLMFSVTGILAYDTVKSLEDAYECYWEHTASIYRL